MCNQDQEQGREHLSLNLMDNGIDFIRSGIEHFFMDEEPDPRSYKYAIIHLYAGILLVLKERLRREHPALVFERVEEAGDGNARTVSFSTLLTRLNALTGIQLSHADEKRLRRTQVLRNRLEHYDVALNLQHAESVIGELSTFIVLFLRDNLGLNLEDHLPRPAWLRMQELREIAERLRREALERWRARAQSYRDLTDEELVALAEVEPYHPKHNPDPDVLYQCPECGEDSLRVVDDDFVGEIGVCTNLECREVCEVEECLRCRRRLFNEEGLCDACQSWIDEQ